MRTRKPLRAEDCANQRTADTMTADQIEIIDCIHAETLSDLSTDDLRRINSEALEELGTDIPERRFEMLCIVSDRAEWELKRRGVTF